MPQYTADVSVVCPVEGLLSRLGIPRARAVCLGFALEKMPAALLVALKKRALAGMLLHPPASTQCVRERDSRAIGKAKPLTLVPGKTHAVWVAGEHLLWSRGLPP